MHHGQWGFPESADAQSCQSRQRLVAGGGVSAYEPQPAYQSLLSLPYSNGRRSVPDVSYDADPASGFSVYDSTSYQGQKGWFKVGGTSAGAPQWAAIRALGGSASNPQ